MRSDSLHPVRRTAPLRVAPVIALVVAVVASVALAGCTSDSPDVDPSPAATSATGSPTASASPSGTPSPSGPPTLPAEAQGRSKAAAVAFVEHWIDVINYTGETLDTGPLRELSAPSCGPCAGAIEAVERIRRAGGRIEDENWTPVEVRALDRQARNVVATIDIAPTTIYERRNAGPTEREGSRVTYIFILQQGRNGQVVRDIQVTS